MKTLLDRLLTLIGRSSKGSIPIGSNTNTIGADDSKRKWADDLKALAYEQETSELKKKWEAASASWQQRLHQIKQEQLKKGGFKDWDTLRVENLKNEPSEFYRSRSWQNLRYEAFKRYGKRCALCGRGSTDGVILHVDHIKPRSKHPELALDIENLQILCEDCNMGKGARDRTKWRK